MLCCAVGGGGWWGVQQRWISMWLDVPPSEGGCIFTYRSEMLLWRRRVTNLQNSSIVLTWTDWQNQSDQWGHESQWFQSLWISKWVRKWTILSFIQHLVTSLTLVCGWEPEGEHGPQTRLTLTWSNWGNHSTTQTTGSDDHSQFQTSAGTTEESSRQLAAISRILLPVYRFLQVSRFQNWSEYLQ